MTTSDNIRAEIHRRHRTGADVARAVGMEPSKWYRRDRDNSWTVQEAKAIAAHLGIPLTALITEGDVA